MSRPVLLDTHVALWWLADDRRLTSSLREVVEGAERVVLSAASTWEVAVKTAVGKLELDLPEGSTFSSTCQDQGFVLEPVTHGDAEAVRDLPPSRTDPFDRLLAAAALRRGWRLASADPAFDHVDGLDVLRP